MLTKAHVLFRLPWLLPHAPPLVPSHDQHTVFYPVVRLCLLMVPLGKAASQTSLILDNFDGFEGCCCNMESDTLHLGPALRFLFVSP